MAKKGKAKISKVKRNNQTTNKMKKQGTLRLQRHSTKVQKNKQPVKTQVEYSSDSESASDEWGDMLDDEEQQYIMKRLAKQPQLLSNVPEKDLEDKKTSNKRKRKKDRAPKVVTPGSDSGAETDIESDLENKYEKEMAERPAKRLRPLLPIKTKEGLLERAEECQDSESEQEENQSKTKQTVGQKESEQGSESDSGMEGTGEEGEAHDGVVGAVELLAARRDRLRHDKLRIGALCSSLLESPEKKLKNLFPILYLMEERLKDGTLNLHSIRKLATLSAYEVFRDILPDYMIRHQDYSNIKLKKDTLSLYKYEKELLEFYKRYLQRLEKASGVLRCRKGDTRKLEESTLSLALVSLRCMSGLLVARPNFNYATNMAQSVVPFLDCRHEEARRIVTDSCTNVFADDKKGEITLTIVRLINQLVKRRGERLQPSALDCLLSLRIRDVDMDAEADVKHKKKTEEKHKKRIVNLSKKEKKRAKKLKEVEHELLETEARESETARRRQLTEVTRCVFHVYFRLLKHAPRAALLAAALRGLARFTHVINVEYYSDLVAILARLVRDELVGARERLLVVRTVLAVLAGAGDALSLDPADFHAHLLDNMLAVHAGSSQPEARVVLESAGEVAARARLVSGALLAALAERLGALAAQLQHPGALACLAQLHRLAQQSKVVSSMLEVEAPEGGAESGGLVGLCVLRALASHYHPDARAAAAALLRASFPQHLHKLPPVQILDMYDGSQMSFKPAIPPPPPPRARAPRPAHAHLWSQNSLKELCESVENNVDMVMTFNKR